MKVGVAFAVVCILAAAWYFGVFGRVSEPRELARAVAEMGPWGYVGFIAMYAVLQPFGVPGTIFVVAASLIWPWQLAFAVSMIGTMSASIVGFSFARFIARQWVSARIPARLRRYGDALERRSLQTIVILRLVFWMQVTLHYFFGVSKVGFWTHFWGSFIGYVPPLLAVSYLGAEMFDASGTMQPAAWPIMAGLLATSVLIAVFARAWERRRVGGGASP
jgi:uncharacterized membrane protein YdjX (TVP38/TMEM64 family)